MIPILTPHEMAAVDAAAPEPVEVLVERAGAATAAAALAMLGGAYGRRVVVLAGKGNNGADGRSAAGRLRRRGVRVEVVDAGTAPQRLPACDLVIDAAYGTGFHGEHHAPAVGQQPVLAVDIPSGVSGATGQPSGTVLAADRTVTFAALKPGLVLDPGRTLAGAVQVVDIGLDVGPRPVGLVERDDVAAWLPPRARQAHKWGSAVLVVAGSPGMTGAAHLAASAAQRAGVGMVRVASPGVDDDRGRLTEAVGVPVPPAGWAAAALAAAERCHAVVVGPGLGTGPGTAQEVRSLLAVGLPLLVDGDGLTALGRDAAELLGARTDPTVLTPHDGEHERLAGHRPGPDRIEAARSLAVATGAVVLLKGSPTVVADPNGEVRVVDTGDARLATAGTGDVLSGVVGALLAQGVPALEAAAAGDLPARVPSALAEVCEGGR